MGSTTDSASQLAQQCLAKFDEVLLRGVLSGNQWAENRRADFNLWVDSVGALAGKRASLDARFESRWRELCLTKSLLVKLSEYLENCLDAHDEDDLARGKQHVDTAIDNLASIAVAIRQTGRKSRLLKADRSFDPTILGDLRTHLECIALIMPALSAESNQEHHENDPLWWQDEMKGNLTSFQRRLIEANLRRRNRFLYAQRHSAKLARRATPAVASQTQTVSPQPPEPERIATPSAQMNVQQQSRPSVQNEEGLAIAPTLSGTSASVPESKVRWTNLQNVIQAPKSQITSIAGAAKYPMFSNPRRASSHETDRMDIDQHRVLKCPCCCEVLPDSVIQSRNLWKLGKHLSVDVSPYTCIAEDCPMPHVLYRTRAEWEDHMKKHHQKKWKCQLCDGSQTSIFSSIDDLTQHVSHEHRDSFPDDLLGTLHLWPSLPLIGLDKCPLCLSTGPQDDPILIDHVLEHTHDFALRSLPWADLPSERIQVSTIRGIYNLNYLQPVEPSEPRGQPLPSMMHIWFDKLEMPESEQWEQTLTALAEISASHPVTDTRQEVSYFTTNNYFAPETEDLSIDIQKHQSPSTRTGEEPNQSPVSLEDSVTGGTATPPPSGSSEPNTNTAKSNKDVEPVLSPFRVDSDGDITQQLESMDILISNDHLEETRQPSAIRTVLQRHQKQALTFMLRRELGWAFDGMQPDLWKAIDTSQGRSFLNRISGAYQSEEPPQCYGGIVADPMGFGKTLTMIALVATDIDSDNRYMETNKENQVDVPATLIVVPPPLIGTWDAQLSWFVLISPSSGECLQWDSHVIEGGLAYRRHHRETRLSSTNELDGLNIVLTTHHTVSAEWNPGKGTESSILYSVRWRRVILDEAHLIRNHNSKMSQAICALESKSRWAVTGTPIQNRLSDLMALLKFIRAYPYADRKCFDADISSLWKSGDYKQAVERLRTLAAYFLLRRAKETVGLPPRRDMQCPVDFSQEERALYNKLRQQTIIRIDEAMKGDFESARTGILVNVLQRFESLRLICNLGLHYHTRHDQVSQTSQEVEDWESIAQGAFNAQREMGPLFCSQCSSKLDIAETLLEDSAVTQQSAQFFSCLTFVCAACTQKIVQSGRIVACGHNPHCPVALVSTNGCALETSLDDIQPHVETAPISLPSKVEALITDIKTLPPDQKCIIFSTWRRTLDIVEAGLERLSIRSVRFDGEVAHKERHNIVDRFKTDSSIRALLLTLSCNSFGLNLTEATRAYIMEPNWNPTLEEEALARLHRLGQTREVTTVRFYVRDSIEEKVMEAQESKKFPAGFLLSPHDDAQADEILVRLQRLQSLI